MSVTFLKPAGSSPSFPVQVIYSGAGVAVPATFVGATPSTPWEAFGSSQFTTATASTAADTLTISPNNGILGRSVRCEFATTGVMPAPLVAGLEYAIVERTATTFKVSSVQNGLPIDLTTAGTGTLTVRMSSIDPGAGAYGLARSLDSSCGTWGRLNPANGAFDWTLSDSFIPYQFSQGRRTLFCLSQTPTWSAVNAALDAYGYPGGGQAPSSLAHAATFITALLARYNAVSAVNPTGQKMIFGVEAWNEPSFRAPGTVGENWCATHAQLAQQTRNVYNAVKAADATCLVLGPGFTSGQALAARSPQSDVVQFLGASDGAAGTGKDWIEGHSYHGYGIGDTSTSIVNLASQIGAVRALATFGGLSGSFPLYQTERGIDAPAEFLVGARAMLIEAALGVRASVHYAWTQYGPYIAPDVTPSLAAAYRTLQSLVAGKTITYCAITQSGQVTAIANGVTVTI